MKKWLKRLTKEQIQRYVFVGLLVLVFAAFFISLSVANNSLDKNDPNQTDVPNGDNGDNNQEVPSQDNKPKEPLKEMIVIPAPSDYVVVRKFYDSTYAEEDQDKAVIQFGKKYYTSNGIALTTKDNSEFDVIASLSGNVKSVDESPIYGTIVTIVHDDGVITEYSSLSEATVVVGATVKQGQVIGKSGVCEYDSALPTHVFFKVVKDLKNLDPELTVGKQTETLGK